jgi:hypothetical protein
VISAHPIPEIRFGTDWANSETEDDAAAMMKTAIALVNL